MTEEKPPEEGKGKYDEQAPLFPAVEARLEDAMRQEKAKAVEATKDAAGGTIPTKPVAQMSRNELVREITRLNRVIDKADFAGLVDRALQRREALKDVPKLLHKEAFMLMRYVSEGGTEVINIWNSRDGVTPFVCYVNGMKFQHEVGKDMGPYLDRPNECDAQWETRTVRQMMEAWHRTVSRALIAGKIQPAQADKIRDDPDVARSWHLHIGLRDVNTGKFSDDF
jgi:hypothetical protein